MVREIEDHRVGAHPPQRLEAHRPRESNLDYSPLVAAFLSMTTIHLNIRPKRAW